MYEKLDNFVGKYMKELCLLSIIIMACVLGYFLAVELLKVERLEISSVSYKEVKMIAEVQPEMIPMINEALADGIINRREYNNLRRKRFEMLNSLETEKSKRDLTDYINQ